MFTITIFGDRGPERKIGYVAADTRTAQVPVSNQFTMLVTADKGGVPIKRIVFSGPHINGTRQERQHPFTLYGDSKTQQPGTFNVRNLGGKWRQLATNKLKSGTHRFAMEVFFDNGQSIKQTIMVNIGVITNMSETENGAASGENVGDGVGPTVNASDENSGDGPVEDGPQPGSDAPEDGPQPGDGGEDSPQAGDGNSGDGGGDGGDSQTQPDDAGSGDTNAGSGDGADDASGAGDDSPDNNPDSGDASGDPATGTGYYIDPFCGQLPVRLSGYGDKAMVDHAEVGALLFELDNVYKSYLRGG